MGRCFASAASAMMSVGSRHRTRHPLCRQDRLNGACWVPGNTSELVIVIPPRKIGDCLVRADQQQRHAAKRQIPANETGAENDQFHAARVDQLGAWQPSPLEPVLDQPSPEHDRFGAALRLQDQTDAPERMVIAQQRYFRRWQQVLRPQRIRKPDGPCRPRPRLSGSAPRRTRRCKIAESLCLDGC